MAAAAQRQYSASFLVGARMLGSFKGVMQQAESRLHRLHSVAMKATAGMLTFLKRFTGVLSIFSAFAAADVFRSVFEGASDAAAAAEQAARKLSILLLQHNEIRKRGIGFSNQIVAKIFAANEALGKQGVIGKQLLNSAAAQLAIYGYSPKKIVGMMGPLADVLVTLRGVNASQEDAAGLADAWGRATKTGMTKPMRQYGFVLSDVQQKEFKGLQNAEKRNNWMLAWAKGYRGVNIAAAATDLGKVQKFHNTLKDMSDQIGQDMLPAQAKMAGAWSKALPQLEPAREWAMKKLAEGGTWAANEVITVVIPAFNQLKAFLTSGAMTKAAGDLWKSLKDTAGKIGKAFGDMLKNLNGGKKFSFGDTLISAMNKLKDGITWVGNNASWLVPILAKLSVGLYALSVAVGVVNVITALSPWVWIAAGIVGLVVAVTELASYFDYLAKKYGSLWNAFKQTGLWKWMVEQFELLKKLWKDIKTAFEVSKDVIVAVFKAIGGAIKDYFLDKIAAIKSAWSDAVNFIKRLNPFGKSWPPSVPTSPAVPQAAAATVGAWNALPRPPKGAATGGIIRGHSLLQVAERGPEAIIPLSGGPRARGLLDYASRAIGMGSTTNNSGDTHAGDTHVTFNVTVNGGATEEDAKRIELSVRRSYIRFIEEFKAAQKHSRRLSFESGYS
ncbi:MAG TPA: hypothetical protein VGG02_14535 [Chthoniobacterales bacterium]|jgi:hypothetical protein